MKIDVLTLFPDMFTNILNESIIKRAIENNLVQINLVNFRKYSKLSNNQVDDTPYGGGSGMVLMCEPIFLAIDELRESNTKVIMMSPQGKTFNQSKAKELAKLEHLIIICGHYEGFDERILSVVDEEISIGDFVLTGGEIPAMAIIDSITRLIPGVINENSIIDESFNNNLLDYPTYTKPQEFRKMKVPEVLLSGNHQKIAEYREIQRKENTSKKRPDLME